jgi:hypothetical protein
LINKDKPTSLKDWFQLPTHTSWMSNVEDATKPQLFSVTPNLSLRATTVKTFSPSHQEENVN